ncbi:MAG: MMPL family transporter [Dorea sp.]|nr:MMPL family transporter [Dorea sp.]
MLSKFSVKRPYTVIVGVVLIMILGYVTFTNMTVDLLPDMNMPYAIVMTTYPGASPEEVETTVTRPVEQSMATISNIKNIQSTSSENASMVMMEFEQTTNMDSATIEMRESLDQIKGYWPEGVGNPLILKLNPSMMPVLIAGVSAEEGTPAKTSKLIKEQVIPEIESLEGVASVTAIGSIEETVEITVNGKKVEELSDEVTAELDRKFEEAGAALAEAKAQVENGKAQLEAGQSQAAAQLGQAEAEMSKKAEELKQAQLEITEKMAELTVSETALDQSLAILQTSKAAANTQLGNLEELYANRELLEQQKAALEQKEQDGTITPEEQEALVQIRLNLELLQNYDTTKAALEQGIAELEAQEQTLLASKQQLTDGKSQLETIQQQVNTGALTLAEARGQMAAAQVQATLGLSSGGTRLAVGESAIAQQEAQMEAAKEEAYAGADMDGVLNVEMMQTLLTAQNFAMPAGYVKEEGISYLVRVGDKFKNIDDIKGLVLLDMEGMDPVRLSDVADVRLVNNADETYAKLNGETAMMLSIQKQTGYSTGDVSDRVLEKLEKLGKDKELGVKTVTLMDQGVYIDLVVNSVLQNLVYGAVLAIVILLIFLRSVKSTLVIACSIPISILTALVSMYFSGITLNVISLSGLALGVGMLVDNSIVVIENIYRMRNEEGASAKDAAIQGAKQVAGAIAASTLTTICVFAPIIFTEGITRQLFVDMGLTIAYSLLASLLVALTVVPMMSAGLLKKTQAGETRVMARVKEEYGKLIVLALKMKPVVLLGALAILIVSAKLAISRGTEFMPSMESTEVSMTLEMEKGSTMEETAAVADEVVERVGKLEDMEDLGAMIGNTSMLSTESDTETAQFYGITKEKPKLNNAELKKEIERVTKDLDGELTVNLSSMDMSALGNSGIVIQVKGKELDTLQKVAGEVKEIAEGVKGTQNVTDGTEDNNEELRVIVDKAKAMSHGLTVAQVYQEISGHISEARSITALSTDTDEYDIYVADDSARTMTRESIRNMKVTATGQDGAKKEVKLADIASFEDASGLQAISRINQNRVMSVSAEIKDGDNIGLVSERIKKELDQYEVPEGYEIEMAGEDETINEAMGEVMKMLALALVFMYLIMVAQFQSLKSPFIIMFTVPLAFTGGFLGLWVTGSAVSVISMVGFVMLSGVIVNNGIVFVDYTNQLIREGMPQREALAEAGRTRLRPIVMTALTTILGLSTMAVGVGMGADMARPMAVVTIGGLLYGTLLTLFVVPCIYDLFHRNGFWKKRKESVHAGVDGNEFLDDNREREKPESFVDIVDETEE